MVINFGEMRFLFPKLISVEVISAILCMPVCMYICLVMFHVQAVVFKWMFNTLMIMGSTMFYFLPLAQIAWLVHLIGTL